MNQHKMTHSRPRLLANNDICKGAPSGAVHTMRCAFVKGSEQGFARRKSASVITTAAGVAQRWRKPLKRWCPESDLNQRPTAYEAVALPLSYQGTLAVLKGASEKLAD